MNHDTLHTLSKQDLVSLIEAQAAQIEAQTAQITSLMARIAELEARLSAPPKTPDNSSTPPSKGQKANLPDRVKSRRGGRAGVSRALSEHPDRIIEATLSAAVRASPVVGSDETSARVGGKNWWQWVLLGSTAIYHVIADTRAASVVTAFMNGARPEVWVADRYGGQLGHGAVRQMCLAHLLRDATYAIDEGDGGFALGFRFLLLRAVAIGRRRDALKDSTLAQYHGDLERRLDRLLAGAVPDKPAARRLFRAMRRDRDDLFRFITRRDVPYTNNACERALRPSVIFRNVTGGFRAEWGAKVYAAAASVIATGRLYRLTALAALRAALEGEPVRRPAEPNRG